jgi:hypothetical protein
MVSDEYETACKKIKDDMSELIAAGNLSKKIKFNELPEG